MKIKKTLGAGVMSLGLVVGLSGFAGATAGSISNTGPDSYNKVKSTSSHWVKVKNNNNLKVQNSSYQSAHTGEANVKHNTTGGDATSGSAMNANSLNASATVNNTSSSSAALSGGGGGGSNTGTISNTGPDSYNQITFKEVSKVQVENNNNLQVHNTSNQTATSGSATVEDNTTGGNATSGDATNTNTTTVSLNVSN